MAFQECLCSSPACDALQGSSSAARWGGTAKYVCIVGLGKKDKADFLPEWGVSPFQVHSHTMASCQNRRR